MRSWIPALVGIVCAVLTGCASTILRATPEEARGTLTLSFDDGPNPGVTERLLDVLAAHEVQAYFCLIGANVEATPEHLALTRRIAAEGHVIVNHGQAPGWAGSLFTAGRTVEDIRACDATLRRALGEGFATPWYRPGGGWMWWWQAPAVGRAGKSVVAIDRYHWDALVTVDGWSALLERMLAQARRGELGQIVIHDGMNGQVGFERRLEQERRYDRSFVPELVDRLLTECRALGVTVLDAKPEP